MACLRCLYFSGSRIEHDGISASGTCCRGRVCGLSCLFVFADDVQDSTFLYSRLKDSQVHR